MSAVDITMIYCLERVTNFTTALQIMNVKGLIIFIYILNKGNMMRHVRKKGLNVSLSFFYCRCVMIILANMQSANKLPKVA